MIDNLNAGLHIFYRKKCSISQPLKNSFCFEPCITSKFYVIPPGLHELHSIGNSECLCGLILAILVIITLKNCDTWFFLPFFLFVGHFKILQENLSYLNIPLNQIIGVKCTEYNKKVQNKVKEIGCFAIYFSINSQ